MIQLDFNKLSKAVKQKIFVDDEITLRQAAANVNISASTLSRIANKRMPDLISYANVCVWLKVPMETFMVKSKLIPKKK